MQFSTLNEIISLLAVQISSLIPKKDFKKNPRAALLPGNIKHLISEPNLFPLLDNVFTSSCCYFIWLKRINTERIMRQARLERKSYCVSRTWRVLRVLLFANNEYVKI